MEEVKWIEVLSRKHEVVSRQRATASTITIGRAYDNDIVFDDPHMAAHHMRLTREDDGIWFAEDLGSINGIVVDGVRQERVALGDDTIVQLGQTGMRVRTSAYAVAPEMLVVRARSHWPAALMALASVLALTWLSSWLGETSEPKPTEYLGILLMCAVAAIAWAALWSILSRVFTGTARYSLNLLIAGIGLAFLALYMQVSEIAAFALSWTALATDAYIVGWLVFAAVCFAHLRALGRVHLPIKAVSVMVLATLGITMQSLQQSADRASSGEAVTLRQLEPPVLRIVRGQSETAFFTSAAELRSTLDKARVRTSRENTGGDVE